MIDPSLRGLLVAAGSAGAWLAAAACFYRASLRYTACGMLMARDVPIGLAESALRAAHRWGFLAMLLSLFAGTLLVFLR